MKIEGKDRDKETDEEESDKNISKEITQDMGEQERKDMDYDVVRIEEESDDEDGIVFRKFQCGDAHNQITNAETDGKERSIQSLEVETTEEITVEDGSRNLERKEVPEVYENGNVGTEETEMEISQNVVENDKDAQQDEKGDFSGSEAVGQKFNFEETEIQKEERNLPVPAPRRSTRPKKPPDRLAEYVTNAMLPRPIDTKLRAVNELMRSGILNTIDTDTAQKILSAIIKQSLLTIHNICYIYHFLFAGELR